MMTRSVYSNTHATLLRDRRELITSCFAVGFALLVVAGCSEPAVDVVSPQSAVAQERSAPLEYPQTPQVRHVDDYHGTKIADPYRWLEDPNSEQTKAWVVAQNNVTMPYLRGIRSRPAINRRLTELWNFERFGLPRVRGKRYFFAHNDGLQNQSVLMFADGADGEPKVLLDPNEWSDEGTVSLASWSPSNDGRFVAYAQSEGGSDWRTWKVIEVETGRETLDLVEWSKFSGASWTADDRGFFYSRYDEPKEGDKLTGRNEFRKLYFHRLGTPQHQDQLIYERKDEPEWAFGGYATEDGEYLVIPVYKGTLPKNQVFYKRMDALDEPAIELIAGFEFSYNFIGNDGSVFYFETDDHAELGRVIAIDLANPGRDQWKEIIPEQQATLEGVSLIGERFFCNYLHHAASKPIVFDASGKKVDEVELPGLGAAHGFNGRQDAKQTFYLYTSYATPPTIYRYEIESGESTLYRQPKVAFDPEKFETKQVFYRSKDGTKVPMFISHKKGLTLSGDNPTVLYGYGGFNNSVTPSYFTTTLVWMEMGGVYAVANIRGGGEYGRPWHEAGIRDKKQNSYDDFIAAAEYLQENKYTSREKLAIRGGSNGGLLVGAVMTQRPELFAAALPNVGVMDMLRYHQFTIGWAWVSDFGSSRDPDEFKTLLAYSPLHNIKEGTEYPATLITTGDHDDRVVPAHSFKFAATLQQAQAGDAPVLIRIETSGGHGAGTPTTKRIDEAADRLAFLTRVLKMPAQSWQQWEE